MEYKFTLNDYRALAEAILANLTSPDYFSGKVEIQGNNDHEISLTLTLVLYRHPSRPFNPDDIGNYITGVGVVWYDINVTLDGSPVEEDFDMGRLKLFLIDE